jgi:hypothetical protein
MLTFDLAADGELIETRRFRVLVLFCEHYVRQGDSLQSIANTHGNIFPGACIELRRKWESCSAVAHVAP